MQVKTFSADSCRLRYCFSGLPRGGHTRSLSEHGSQAPHRRWYLAHGPGRVGRRWILEAPCPVGRGPLRFWRPFRLRLHSRDHARSIPGTCRSRPLDGKPSRGLFRSIRIRPYEFYIHPRHHDRSLMAHGPLPSDGERDPYFFIPFLQITRAIAARLAPPMARVPFFL